MGGGGQKSSGTTTETKEIKLPAWVDAASQENYKRAQGVADRPFEQYQGDTVAGMSPLFDQAKGMLGNLGQYQGQYGAAGDALAGMLGYNPAAINAGQYDAAQYAGTNLDPYMNPWISNVEDRTTANMLRTGTQQQNELAGAAGQAKAFGGSRHEMEAAMLGAENQRNIGDMAAKLRSEGYDKATGLAVGDVAARNAALSANAAARQKAEESSRQNEIQAMLAKTGAAKQMTDTADAGQKSYMNQMAEMLGLGSLEQEQSQRELDDKARRWQEQRDYPLEQLNIIMAALGMSPYGHTETGTKTETQKSSGGGGGMGGMLGGGMQLLTGLMSMSDRSTKTDIEPLGHDDETDLPIYAYRYKKDPKTYPKSVGPMAQDVEKKYPHLVRKVNGKRVIDLSGLAT